MKLERADPTLLAPMTKKAFDVKSSIRGNAKIITNQVCNNYLLMGKIGGPRCKTTATERKAWPILHWLTKVRRVNIIDVF